ncbi:MAG: D-alanyl-D-alanine carboxypeptidase family protein [Candidatus Colwellbacteria bacterium]|nr:D-alanyl-D-alanine carboxypeptidase family protein [Candidatus Colwellbacteria bacterium]
MNLSKCKKLFIGLAIIASVAFLGGQAQAAELSSSTSITSADLQLLNAIVSEESAQGWRAFNGFPRDLQLNDVGEDIALIQQALGELASIYPEKKVTGFFGPLTLKAVKKFQALYGIPENGKIGPKTRVALDRVLYQSDCPKPEKKFTDFSLYPVDRGRQLPDYTYTPQNLINLEAWIPTVARPVCLKKEAARELILMFQDASKENLNLAVTSGFRTLERQSDLYVYSISQEGLMAERAVAAPGRSEHQLGTAVDFTSKSADLKGATVSFANTKEGQWLTLNSYKYGFVLSYPAELQGATGYQYEPWHFRYVGKNIAKTVFESKIPLNSYLYALANP